LAYDVVREGLVMSLCPKCKLPGAYVGFNSIECRNKDCEYFVLTEDTTCPCCRDAYHDDGEPCPGPDGAAYGPGRGLGNGRLMRSPNVSKRKGPGSGGGGPAPIQPGEGLTQPQKEPAE